jgi:primosomal protein N' (replication factor Y)
LFPVNEIAFFKWVAKYYIFPLGEVIKTALPSGLDRQDVSCVFVTPGGIKAFSSDELSPGEACVIQFLKEKEGCTLKQLLKNSSNPSIVALVRKMEKNDLLTVSAVLKIFGCPRNANKF